MARSADIELAGLGTRLIALIIDGMILSLIAWGLSLVLGNSVVYSLIGTLLIAIGYQWYFLTRQSGQTMGKKIMEIRVVKVNGQPLQGSDAVIRYFGYIINSMVVMLGWIWAAFDANRQGWHDKLAGTYVVKA